MQPNNSEFQAIKIAEGFVNQKPLPFLKKILSKGFQFTNYEVSPEKSLSALWGKFGLRDDIYDSFFSEENKIKCISEWFKILYRFDVNIIIEYQKYKEEFNTKAQKFYQQNPHMHVSWIFPDPENFLLKITERFGTYDNPIFSKQEITDIELFEFGITYIKNKIKENDYEIVQSQDPPFVPQFVLKKSNVSYFLYCKIVRAPESMSELFTGYEIDGYNRYCQKHCSKLLLAGMVVSNGNNESYPLYKEDKLAVEFTGILNASE
jgi:hypothetical protein